MVARIGRITREPCSALAAARISTARRSNTHPCRRDETYEPHCPFINTGEGLPAKRHVIGDRIRNAALALRGLRWLISTVLRPELILTVLLILRPLSLEHFAIRQFDFVRNEIRAVVLIQLVVAFRKRSAVVNAAPTVGGAGAAGAGLTGAGAGGAR